LKSIIADKQNGKAILPLRRFLRDVNIILRIASNNFQFKVPNPPSDVLLELGQYGGEHKEWLMRLLNVYKDKN
jgi:hypothetical protein